jgi:hypothetical protein
MKAFNLFLVLLLSFCFTQALVTFTGVTQAEDKNVKKAVISQGVPITINCPSMVPASGIVNAKYSQDGWTDAPLGTGGTASDPLASIFMQEMHCVYHIGTSDNKQFSFSARIMKKWPSKYRCEVSGKASFLCKPE